MTVVFTAARLFGIVAACDSAVKEEIGDDQVSYSRGKKGFVVPNVGVVTTWGARDGNGIGQFLHKRLEFNTIASVVELAAAVDQYLRNDYDPRQRGLGHVGYHVSGFVERKPRVYHVFWQPADETREEGSYEFQTHTPAAGLFMLYNGRDRIAHSVVSSFLDEFAQTSVRPLKLDTAFGLAALSHLVLRFASEITFDVGAPFYAHVISPDNEVYSVELPISQPLHDEHLLRIIKFHNEVSRLR